VVSSVLGVHVLSLAGWPQRALIAASELPLRAVLPLAPGELPRSVLAWQDSRVAVVL